MCLDHWTAGHGKYVRQQLENNSPPRVDRFPILYRTIWRCSVVAHVPISHPCFEELTCSLGFRFRVNTGLWTRLINDG